MIKRTNSQQFDQQGNQVANNRQSIGSSSQSRQSNSIGNKKKSQVNQSKIIKHINNKSDDTILDQQKKDVVHSLYQRPLATNDIKFSQNMRGTYVQNQYMKGSANKRGLFQKMPDSIKQSIVKLASGKRPAGSMTASKVSKALFEKYRQFKNNSFICQICSCEYQQKFKAKLSNCQHVFCDSCLRHYVDYKISRFQQVLCPAEGCDQIMDVNSPFYISLTTQLKQKYQKVHAFSQVSKNPNSRLCPNEKCNDGILNIQQGKSPKCSKCQKVYCAKCLFVQHAGPCQKNQLDFFQNNLHFRQCTQCKNVVEKTVGCNHIKCRCGYQFCYLCGAKWLNYQHKCGPAINAIAAAQVAPVIPQNNCSQCLQGDGCCTTILKLMIKLLILPLYLFLLAVLILKAFLFVGLLFGITIIMGMFPYTCQFICDANCPFNVILVIFYPIAICIGIVRAVLDFFCQGAARVFQSLCQQIPAITQCLLGW